MMSANRKAVGALQFFRPLREWKYSEVVDWAGREISPGKRGFIPADTPPILARLGMDAAPVLDYLSRKEKQSYGALGPVSMLRAITRSIGQRFVKGQAVGRRLCPESN